MVLATRCVALTGASGGIGGALTRELVRAGARVIAIGRSEPALQALVQEHGPDRVVPVIADLTTPQGVRDVARVMDEQGASILVLAHAQPAFGLFGEQSDRQMRQVVDTNLIAPMLLIRAALPTLKRYQQAAVVAIGSTLGSLAHPGFAAYGATKFGLRGLIEGLAREYADTPILFQYLAPRATRTSFNSAAAEAMNRELKVGQDDPAEVAAQLVRAIERGDARRQLGWPESLFVRINQLFPGVVDRSLRSKLHIVRRHAGATTPQSQSLEHNHDEVPN